MTAPIQLEVFRHGETTRNAQRRISGSADVALTQRGSRQATQLGKGLEGIYQVAFHSPLARSRASLDIALAASMGTVKAVQSDPRLSERSMGVLEGEASRPIPAYDQGDLAWAPPGGEPYLSVTLRILSFLLDLSELATGLPEGEPVRVLVCTHVGPMRILLGIVDEVDDARAVLTSQFDNAQVQKRHLDHLSWPPFLDPTIVS